MKSNIIFKTAKVAMAALTMGAMTTACNDWDDHYEANSSEIGSSSSSLWENISTDSNLSEFAALAKKTGYDKILSNMQTYTVWAPLNGTFDFETLNNMNEETLKKQFMQNHVSHFSYPAVGSINSRVFMLNDKMNVFEGNGTYTMGGVQVKNANIANSNGILHTIDGKLNFNFNIYESLNADTYPIDSISAYFAKYHKKELDIKNSVKGPVVDGEITYLDSVFTEYNALANRLDAYIDREDSSYTMIVPTNDAWEEKLNQMKEANEYLPEYVYYRKLERTLGYSDSTKEKEFVDNEYLKDSLSHYLLIPSLVFNNNLYDNGNLKTLQTGETLAVDSLVSTRGKKFYSEDAAEIFKGAKKVEKSNGAVWVTDNLNFKPWAYRPYIKFDAEYASFLNLFAYSNCETNLISVRGTNLNPEVEGRPSDNGYLEARPKNAASNPELAFYIPNVMKGKYVLYIGIVPANIDVTTYNPEVKPNVMQVTVGYHNTKGSMDELRMGSSYTNDCSKVDTLRIGEVDFPVSTYGLEHAKPYVRINGRVSSSTNATRDRTLRIDFIMLVPKELDDYIQENPGYKWEDESNK